MTFKENIEYLSELSGVSGNEHTVASEVKRMFEKYADSVSISPLGSVVAKIGGQTPGTGSVMIEAHLDEIGLIVCGIDDNGFVKFTNIGGVDPRILVGSEVVIHGKEDVFGVIGAKPPHLMSEDEYDKSLPIKDLFIDAGYDKDRAKEIIEVGDVITFFSESRTLLNHCLSSKSMDDRCAVAILIEVMKNIREANVPFDIYFVAATMEETNGSGAVSTAYDINPDFAIVIDVTHGDTPDASPSETFKLGEGNTVVAVGPNIHPKLKDNFIKVLEDNNLNFLLEIEGGNTGTDAWGIQVAKNGIPCLLLSVPLRYMHTFNEVISLSDASATSDAISVFIKSIGKAGEAIC